MYSETGKPSFLPWISPNPFTSTNTCFFPPLTSPPRTSCAPLVYKTLIFSHSHAFDHVMPQPRLSYMLTVNSNALSYMKPSPLLRARYKYSGLATCYPCPLFVPFITSPLSAFCCRYLYSYMLYLPVLACSLLESCLVCLLHLMPPNSLLCAICTVDVYGTELLNNRC